MYHLVNFDDIYEIEFALENKDITLHTKIYCRISNFDGSISKVETTPGRMILSDALPKNKDISFDLLNKTLTKKE